MRITVEFREKQGDGGIGAAFAENSRVAAGVPGDAVATRHEA
jgi:hypothetical protein